MRCPSCRTPTLQMQEVAPALSALVCASCRGKWFNSFQLWAWLEQLDRPRTPPATVPAAASPGAVEEKKGAKICPECGRILVWFKVGDGLDFSLERCGQCGGVWFEGQEWEALAGRKMLGSIPLIFSSGWQKRVRLEESRANLEALFRQKVGAADFAEIERVKAWLAAHPHRRELLAWLQEMAGEEKTPE